MRLWYFPSKECKDFSIWLSFLKLAQMALQSVADSFLSLL